MKNLRLTTKGVVALMASTLLLGGAIGGTMAWLTDKTETVENTFTVGDINIELTETFNTDTDGDGENDKWTAKLIPGSTYTKDPEVTVKANSEKCYLFVEFKEENNPSTYLIYTSNLTAANGWTQGDGTGIPNYVWYRIVESSNADQSWDLLANDTVEVRDNIVKTGTSTGSTTVDMPATGAAPTLTYTAYAVQFANMDDAADAWSNKLATTATN